MATRYPPLFDIRTGLLSNQEMTPEEEAAWLAEQERLYGVPIDTNPPPEEDQEDTYLPPEETVPEAQNDDNVDFGNEPLVTDVETVATDLSNLPDLSNDPLAPLPEGIKEPPRTSQEPTKKPEKKEPLVTEAKEPKKEDGPLVVNSESELDRGNNWVARHKAEAQAMIAAQEKQKKKNVEVDPITAAYAEHFEGIINQMLAEGANSQEIQQAGRDLARDVYNNEALANWDPASVDRVVRDFDTRVEKGRHVPYYRTQVTGKETDKEPGGQPMAIQSLAKGVAMTRETLWGGVEAGAEIVGADKVAKTAGNKRMFYNHVAKALPEGTRLEDVQSFGDALRFAGQTALEQAPNLATALEGGLIGGVVAGSTGAALGAFGPSWAMETGSIQSQNKELNSGQKAGLTTILGGGAAAVLDSVLPGKVGAQLTRRIGEKAANDVAMRILLMPADKQLMARLREAGWQGLKGTAIESSTEAGQTLVEEIATSIETGKPIEPGILFRMTEAAVAGGILGGPTGAAGSLVETSGDLPEARPIVADVADRGPVTVVKTSRTPVNAEGQAEQFTLPNGRITSKFGPRQTFRTANGQMASSNHAGVDIALPSGAPAPAGASGVVVFAGKKGGYGNQVVVQHSDGTTSSYSHLSKIGVEVGDQVAQGESVGKVGKTGNATGPHLHVERRDRQGRAVNPLTGGRVITVRDEATGEWTDNTDFAANQKPVDNFWEDAFDQAEAENAYEDATGQRLRREEEVPAPEEAAPTGAMAAEAPVAIARGDNVTAAITTQEPPAPARGVVEAVSAVVAGPGAKDIAAAATADLDAAKTRNTASLALANRRGQTDLTQPQEGEEPVFADAAEGSEVIGFNNPETGVFRAIGEPAIQSVAQPEETAPTEPTAPTPTDTLTPTTEPVGAPVAPEGLPEAPSGVPVEEAPQRLAATTEQLELERKQRLLAALPNPPATASNAVKMSRIAGQEAGLGLRERSPDSPNQEANTAYNLGFMEGQKALAQDFVAAGQGVTMATTPEVATSSIPAANKANKIAVSKKEAAAIDQRADKYEEKLFDLETDGSKSGARIFIQRLIRDGVLPADAMSNYANMFKDRDMGVEDITSELRTDIQLWADEQKAGKDAVKETAKPAPKKPAPKKIKKKVVERPQKTAEEAQTRVAFEVAPSPSSAEAAAWRKLPPAKRESITRQISERLVAYVKQVTRAAVDVVGNVGGYQGETNPSVTLSTIVHTRADEIARILGYSLDQDSVMILSEQPISGSTPATIVRVSTGGQNPAEIYDRLWQADKKLASGFLMDGDEMLIVDTEGVANLGEKIDAALDGKYNVSEHKGHAQFIERGEDNYGYGEEGTGSRPPLIDYWRGQALDARAEAVGPVEGGRETAAQRRAKELQAPPVENDGSIILDHWSPEEGLTETDPAYTGQNRHVFSRDELNYLASAPSRTYFGIQTGEPGGYRNEFPSRNKYQTRIPANKLYDVATDPDGLWVSGKAHLGEHAIKDAGYYGYWNKDPSLGLVAVVFKKMPVAQAKAPVKKSVEVKAKVKNVTTINEVITDQMVKDIAGVLRQMQLDGHPDLTVELVDSLEGAQGQYDPSTRLITIAAMTKGKRAKTANIAKHEIIHWMRDNKVIDRDEWRALREWVEKNPALVNWAQAHYANEGLTRDEMLEEAIAEGFSRWQGGDIQKISAADSKIEAIFEKILRVLRAISDAISGAGITRGQISKAQAIFEDIASGEQARKSKARGQTKPTVTFGKKRTAWQEGLSREMLNGNISVEQRVFLENNPSVATKFQSAYHGSAKEDIDQFKLDFIGTGEGAQAFGWGLYFAQREDVAEWYRKKIVLGGRLGPVDAVIQINGTPFREFFGNDSFDAGAVYEVADRVMNFYGQGNKPYNGWLEALHAEFDNDIAEWVRQAEADAKANPEVAGEMENEISMLKESQTNVNDVFRALKAHGGEGQNSTIKVASVEGGKIYKVEVPENNELIMLDHTVAKQSPEVKQALYQVRDTLEKNGVLEDFEDRYGDFEDWTGLELTRVVMPNAIYQGIEPDGKISGELDNALTNGHSQMATSVWLRDLGVKGARYYDRESRNGQPHGTVNFVIFDDSAITLKAKKKVISTPVNSPLSDPTVTNPGIFRQLHNQTMGLLGAIAGKDVDAADNLVDAFRRKVTQRYQQIIKTQDRSAQMLGVDRLPSGQNPMEMITADERGYKLQFLTDNMIRPMAKELAQRGLTLDDLGLFLYARHAPHRNARIAQINPDFRSPSNPGSGMTDAEAHQIMADFQSDGKINDLMSVATHIDAMVAFAQNERLQSGLISPQDAANGFAPSDFYVPLRGNENIDPELEMEFTLAARKGGGFSVSGKESHRMFGRASKADLEEIVGYTITQAQEAIDRGYRNRVGQAMLGMFRTTPDPDFVKIDRVKRVAVWNKKKGQVEYQMQTRITDPKEQQRTIYVKENGSVTKMTFQATNPSAMRFVAAAKNLGMSELPRLLQLTSVFTRVWTKSNTQWNPDFILANATKDVQTGLLNSKTLDQKGLRRRMLKNLASLGPLRGAFFGSMHGAGAGFNSSSPWHQVFAEFEANGGKLNYGQIEPLEDAIRSAKREMRNAKRSAVHPIKVATGVGNFIDHLNSAFENMTRLAAYKALRDLGVPPKQAAEAVRELTTNFQQHGEWGPKVNAAYGFANASIIGGARFAKTVAKSPAIAVGLISLGMMVDFLNSLYDEDEWDQYTEEDKHANFIILLPDDLGFDIKIPAGYGINSFTTAGRKMSELWRGKKKKDGTKLSVLDAAADTALGFINSFSPITGQSFWNIVTPTLGDPIVNIYRNENNWGRPIMPPQPFRKEQQKPDSQLAFDNTSQFWKSLATTMNMIGGGNEVVPGLTPLDMSPETYKHVTEEMVGGAGRTFMRTIGLIEKAVTGKDVGLNDVPILRRFAGNPYGAATAKDEQIGAFYDRLNQGRVAIAQAKEMMARYGKDSETYQEYRKENEPLINFAATIEAADKRLRAYNTAENAAERGATRAKGLKRRDRKAIFKVTRIVVPANRPLTDEEVAKVKAKVKEKKERLAARFNELYLADVMKEEAEE